MHVTYRAYAPMHYDSQIICKNPIKTEVPTGEW